MDQDSATTLAEHFKDLVFKEAYETMHCRSASTAFTEHK
jgi:hypothetical protein